MTGSVTPSAPGKMVELQLRAGGRWRTVSTGRLSRKSSFSLAARLTGVGGHFLRVVKLQGSGHAQGVSNIVEIIVAARRTVHSHGGALNVTLGAVTVSAPVGAIGKGQTLSISVGSRTGFGPENGVSVAGGPYVVSTSQREPKRPVTVTLRYDPGLLAGDKPLFLHGLTATHSWVPEIATVHGQSASATLDSFSPMDIVDWGTYYAGILTGNRADLPGGCGATPSWIDSATLPDSNQDPLPVCFGSQSNNDEAVLNVVNNRGYAQTITVSGAKIDVAKSIFAGSFEGQIGKLLAQLGSGDGPSVFMLGPGESAMVAIDRPPPQQAALEIHIDPAAKTASGVGELAWALLTTAKDQIGVPLDTENCVLAAVHSTVSSDRGQDSAIAQMHSCVNAASGLSGVAKDVLQKLAYGLLVDDFFYKVVDLEGDELYPAMIGFTIPGSNPTFTSPDIHISPLNLGTLPDGQTTTVQLTATGGTAPYRFYIWNEPTNAAKVPSWVHLATDGTLTVEPSGSGSGEVRFAVYAFDANGDHSPFAREEIIFQTTSAGGSGGGEGPRAGGLDLVSNWTDFEAPLPAGEHLGEWRDQGSLDAISCPTQGTCVAVGPGFQKRGWIEMLKDGKWTAINAPAPPQSTEQPEIGLDSVSCSTSDNCVAVGYYRTLDGGYRGLIETLRGTEWTGIAAPVPDDAAAESASGEQFSDYLRTVACIAPNECFAVGSYVAANEGSDYNAALVDSLNEGGTWQAEAVPVVPERREGDSLSDITCPASNYCVAVGTSSDATGLIEEWNGSTWTEREVPQPTESGVTYTALELSKVACASRTHCVAITEPYVDGRVPLETMNNGTWEATIAPLPAGVSEGVASYMFSVGCVSGGNCLVAGDFEGVAEGSVLEQDDGASRWTAVRTMMEAGGQNELACIVRASCIFRGYGLGAITCQADEQCIGVGWAEGIPFQGLASFDLWTAQKWQPANILPIPSGGDDYYDASADLSAVSCTSATWCVAVGSFSDSEGEHGLIEIGEG
jgi:hypothetical protein